MKRLALAFPVLPHLVTRAWGVPDPAYRRFGFERHNGVDLALQEGQPVYAPFDCRVKEVGDQPDGSGLYVCLLSRRTYRFDDGTASRVEVTLMHLSRVSVSKGTRLRAGDPAGLGGSTGWSTGPHLHVAPKRVRGGYVRGYRDRDRNDAGNTFDPGPYWMAERLDPSAGQEAQAAKEA